MRRKFILTDETRKFNGGTQYRIKAVRDFGDVKKGQLGGFVEHEYQLDHNGKCWLYDNASIVGETGCVMENAKVYDTAIICNSYISGNAEIRGHYNWIRDACITSDARIENWRDYVVLHGIVPFPRLYNEVDIMTFFKCSHNIIRVKYAHGHGHTVNQFKNRMIQLYEKEDPRYVDEILALVNLINIHFHKNNS